MSKQRAAEAVIDAVSCDRVTCDREAMVLLVFDPRLSEAWLRDLESDSRLVGITLCVEHANRVTVPAGWSLSDDRSRKRRAAGARARDRAATAEPAEPAVRLASVTAITDPAESESVSDESVSDEEVQAAVESKADAEPADDNTADDGPEETDPDIDDDDPDDDGIIERPTLWDGDEPEGLRVDSSTPMLSRAFRAAHID